MEEDNGSMQSGINETIAAGEEIIGDNDEKLLSQNKDGLDKKSISSEKRASCSLDDSREDLDQENETSKCLKISTSDNPKQDCIDDMLPNKEKNCLLKSNEVSVITCKTNIGDEKEKDLFKEINSLNNLNKLQMPPENIADESRTQSLCSSVSYTGTSCADFCRICHCENDPDLGPLIAPCHCSGSLRHVHQSCLQQWIKSSDSKHCELCGYQFVMDSKLKPFRKWEKLSMTKSERRKIVCSVMFHIIAITCVVWSLYVLIGRTADEIRTGKLHWPFWTKLVVVAIGITGGLVFMYVQCKVYVLLWRRLKAFNRVIYVQNHTKETSLNVKKIECIATRTTTLDRRNEQCTSHSMQRTHSVVIVDVCNQSNGN